MILKDGVETRSERPVCISLQSHRAVIGWRVNCFLLIKMIDFLFIYCVCGSFSEVFLMVQNNSWVNMWECSQGLKTDWKEFFFCFATFNWIISGIHAQWCRTIQAADRSPSVLRPVTSTRVEPTCSRSGSETENGRHTGQLTCLSMLHTSWFSLCRRQRVV